MSYARSGAILPHAPLLLPEAARRPPLPEVERVRAAARQVGRGLAAGPLVVVSSRAPATGIYRETGGDLARAGIEGIETTAPRDDPLAIALGEVWDRPVLEGAWDQGAAVAIALAGLTDRPLVVAGLAGTSAWEDEALSLATALRSLDEPPVVAACSHTGAGITPRAPLTEMLGGEQLEREVAEGLKRDAGSLQASAVRLAAEQGSSGAAPLFLMGHLFAGTPGIVHAHEWPYGVGYLVATIGGMR